MVRRGLARDCARFSGRRYRAAERQAAAAGATIRASYQVPVPSEGQVDQSDPGRRERRHPCRPWAAARRAQARLAEVPDRGLPARPAAEWSEELLAAELAWLRDESFELDLVGFDATELERLLALASGEF